MTAPRYQVRSKPPRRAARSLTPPGPQMVQVDGYASPADLAPVVRTHYGLSTYVWVGAIHDALAQGLEVHLSILPAGAEIVSIGRPAKPGWTNTELEEEAA